MRPVFRILVLLAAFLAGINTGPARSAIYIGTYTSGSSKGIYHADWDPVRGIASHLELAVATQNPSFLTVAPNHRCLYAVGEMSNLDGKGTGAVSAFAINSTNGYLTLLNQTETGGSGPCHVSLDGAGTTLLVANYGSGSIACFPIQKDGKLAPASMVIQHHGSSVNPQRQSGPHAHFIMTDPGNRFALTCDLGLDRILSYSLNAKSSLLSPNASSFISIKPGSGPRHLTFSPDGKSVFAINEMSSTITSMAYNQKSGALKELQSISTLPDDFSGHSSGAEIQLHPSGKFLYGSNRGHDSIAVYRVNPKSGRLSRVENVPTEGKTPRHFTLDPSGRWLLAENQDSGTVVVFEVDSASGKLEPNGQVLNVGSPVCAVFVP